MLFFLNSFATNIFERCVTMYLICTLSDGQPFDRQRSLSESGNLLFMAIHLIIGWQVIEVEYRTQ